ncbi:MAG: bi-domain-containing oxidoreductase [Hyphomicrobiaceae bacterium]
MRQVLISSSEALVARMPAPSVAPGSVLVRTRFSLISTGTELASLTPIASSLKGGTALEQAVELSSRATFYLGKAVRDPRKAAERAKSMVSAFVGSKLAMARPKPTPLTSAPAVPIVIGATRWEKSAATSFEVSGTRLKLVTDASPGSYQALSQVIKIPAGHSLELRLEGELVDAPLGLGLLNHDRSAWITQLTLEPGPIKDNFWFDIPAGSPEVTIVICNAGAEKPATLSLVRAEIAANPPDASGLPASEMSQQGWNVGYSAAGEVVAVGEGIKDLAIGDWVACAGAGQANHADYIVVKRNLVARVPKGCPLEHAATTTVGSIAMQGVRRADAKLGEVVVVIGLGLIGMITVELLKATGARVIGIDINKARVKKALEIGIDAVTAEPSQLWPLVRDMTDGHGADQTIITAASKSHVLINQAMEVTRRRGRVVIVGDIGLKPERTHFYRKEIDLLMSTSYGPGRYDASYEDEGRDYPYGYVRWTQNRNMQSYLDLIASGRIDIAPMIERIVPINDAPAAYRDLAQSGQPLPLGVLISYPEDERPQPQAPDAAKIMLRGARSPQTGRVNYALVGAGAFGTHMLVPQMDKRSDRFFLRAVVSRDATRGGNFARSRRVQVLASGIDEVLHDTSIDLLVIATRHSEHAQQAVAALGAGKAVFVEKPLALSWDELDQVRKAYAAASAKEAGAMLMVGFNRRFAPAIEKLGEVLAGRRSPLMINYRLNGGYIAPDHWIQGREGGGRNIGEACHMYDLFRSLAGATVKGITASAIDPGRSAYLKSDNFMANLTYEDGTVGNLVYTALGPREGLPKERIEVFCDGEAYIVDDFKSLTKASSGEVLWQSRTMDKGHFTELSRFGDAIASGEAAPIPFDEIVETTAVSLHIEDLLHGRV